MNIPCGRPWNSAHVITGSVGVTASMAKRKKARKFSAASAVKAMARDVLGTPPPTRPEENKKRNKKPKHKPTLGKLLADN